MSVEGHRPEEAPTSGEQDLRLLVEAIPTLGTGKVDLRAAREIAAGCVEKSLEVAA